MSNIEHWVFENHEHHEGSKVSEFNLGTGEFIGHRDISFCIDGNYPYVNSKSLIELLEQLKN